MSAAHPPRSRIERTGSKRGDEIPHTPLALEAPEPVGNEYSRPMAGPKVVRKGPLTCAYCAGPMPPVASKGPPAIYCRPGCRKAAHEARRRNDPAAFEVKIVTTERLVEHSLSECVDHALASPRAFRRMLEELTKLVRDDDMSDPKWSLLFEPLEHFRVELEARERRRRRAEDTRRSWR